MKRALTVNAYVQSSVLTSNGLEDVVTWQDGAQYPVRILPASAAEVQRAGLRDDFATHSAVLPRGLTLSAMKNRLRVGTQIYRIVNTMNTTRSTMLLLEERLGDA